MTMRSLCVVATAAAATSTPAASISLRPLSIPPPPRRILAVADEAHRSRGLRCHNVSSRKQLYIARGTAKIVMGIRAVESYDASFQLQAEVIREEEEFFSFRAFFPDSFVSCALCWFGLRETDSRDMREWCACIGWYAEWSVVAVIAIFRLVLQPGTYLHMHFFLPSFLPSFAAAVWSSVKDSIWIRPPTK